MKTREPGELEAGFALVSVMYEAERRGKASVLLPFTYERPFHSVAISIIPYHENVLLSVRAAEWSVQILRGFDP